jgi:PAS domain S-box-containing protein
MFHAILQHQLEAAGLSTESPPDSAGWTQFLNGLHQELESFTSEVVSSQTLVNELLTNIPVGILAQDQAARIVFTNQSAYKLLGLTEDQFLGRSSFDPDWNVIHEDGSDFPGPEHPGPKALASGQEVRDVVMGVYRPATKDRVWILVNALPQPMTGTAPGVLVTFSDITAQRRAAEQAHQLAIQKAMMSHSTTLLESVGQNYRTPLSVINSSLHVLRHKTEGNAALTPYINMLNAQVERLTWAIEEALLISRLESGLVQPGFNHMNINGLVHDLVRKMEVTFAGKMQSLHIYLGKDLPQVNADWHYLGVAIEHLLIRSSQAAPADSNICVSTRLHQGQVIIQIEDLGPGNLPPRNPEWPAAEPDGEDSGSPSIPVVEKIMALHGGSLRAVGAAGKASRFTLGLPVPD